MVGTKNIKKIAKKAIRRSEVWVSGNFHSCKFFEALTGAPNGNFRENICSEDDLRSRILGAFVVKFLACLPLLGFWNIYKMA